MELETVLYLVPSKTLASWPETKQKSATSYRYVKDVPYRDNFYDSISTFLYTLIYVGEKTSLTKFTVSVRKIPLKRYLRCMDR
jgi:hypothetical protein